MSARCCRTLSGETISTVSAKPASCRATMTSDCARSSTSIRPSRSLVGGLDAVPEQIAQDVQTVRVGPEPHDDRRPLRVHVDDDGAPGVRQVEVVGPHGRPLGDHHRLHAAHAEGALPRVRVAHQVPGVVLDDEPERMHRPRRGASVASAVAQVDLDPVDDGALERLEMRRGRGLRVVPSRRVPDHGPGRRLGVGTEGGREGADQLAQSGPHLGGGGTGPGDEEERPGLVRGEPAQVRPGPADELPPSATAGLGVHGDACHGEALRGPGGPCARSPRAPRPARPRSPAPSPGGRGGRRRGDRRAWAQFRSKSGQKMASLGRSMASSLERRRLRTAETETTPCQDSYPR